MNYLLEIVIFNAAIFTICGINMKKKGRIGIIQEYPKAIQDRCRELGLIQESSEKLVRKVTVGKLGYFSIPEMKTRSLKCLKLAGASNCRYTSDKGV